MLAAGAVDYAFSRNLTCVCVSMVCVCVYVHHCMSMVCVCITACLWRVCASLHVYGVCVGVCVFNH